MSEKYKNISIITQEAVASIRAGEPFNTDKAFEQLSDDEIKTLAADGLMHWVNENFRAEAEANETEVPE